MSLETRRLFAAAAAALGLGAFAPAISPPPPDVAAREASVLEVLDVTTGARRVVLRTPDHIEAPNWTPDGRFLIYNGGGRLLRIPATGGAPQVIDTGDAVHLNNDHGPSPDGEHIAMSDESAGVSQIKVGPARGGRPRTLTGREPSYFHGWSPDGRTLAFVGDRDGNFDIYAMAAEGGPERRLTTDPAPDDGPDYDRRGRVWFNSARSGRMQIWRMDGDGGRQTRVTTDPAYADWFPHPSPDGRLVSILSYSGDVTGHPGALPVSLRLMDLARGGVLRTLLTLHGGQGTINVNSWAPDSRRLAFVRYLPVHP